MDVGGWVLREGDPVRATGRLVGRLGDPEGGAWFEPPLATPLVGHVPGRQPPPRPSPVGVPVRGADLARRAVADRREAEGAVEGWATVTGRWHDGGLRVTGQEPGRPTNSGGEPRWVDPPLDRPGGWPPGRIQAGLLPVPDDVLAAAGGTAVTLFRRDSAQEVLVVAVVDLPRAERVLRPTYGERLCLVRSHWSGAQVARVAGRLRSEAAGWGIYECATSATETGQPLVTADVVRVTRPLADWAMAVPDGLLRLYAWLVPQRT